jgi:hypothetical protein
MPTDVFDVGVAYFLALVGGFALALMWLRLLRTILGWFGL